MDSRERGVAGEELAATFLVSLGYTVLGRNIRARWSEGDILCQDGEVVVLVEVKARRNNTTDPLLAITVAKRRRLRRLLNLLSVKYPNQDIRLDAITVYWNQVTKAPILTHYLNIF